VVGIIGPNGSGKSTLLATISGLLVPDSGRVVIDGHDLAGKSAVAYAQVGVARTFQQPRLVPALKIWENLVVGEGQRLDAGAVRRAAEAAGVGDALDKWPDELPAAVARRAEVARALLRDPKVLLLDEPAAGLTEAESRAFSAMVTELGLSRLVVIVEHNMNVISTVADRVIALVEGQLIAQGSPEEVQSVPQVRSAYFGLPIGSAQ
jgi:ABC-type branched-subunit amino acid transport system ATPase component